MKDLRRTALISAALMGIQPLWVLVFAIRRFVISPHLLPWSWQWPFLLSATTDLIWLVALPTLFFLLYLTAATLPVSRRQRSLAVVMALLQTVSVLISLWTRWKRNMNANWHNVTLARSLLRDLGLMEWLSSVREVVSLTADLLTLLWQLGLLIFLVALTIPEPPVSAGDDHRSSLQESAIRLTKFASVLAIAFPLGIHLYAEFLPNFPMRYYDTSLLAQARRLPWGLLPQLITPAIVWLSLRRYQANSKQSLQPGSTASARSDAAASSPEA
jgi:hypothetical protein